MIRYAALCHPGHNRVYFAESLRLSLAELEIASRSLAEPAAGAGIERIGGVEYLTFRRETPLSAREAEAIFRLSFPYALFRVEGDSLEPVERPAYEAFSEDIGGHLRYSGKTNERFTRLLLGLAIHSGAFAGAGRLSILDPLCGKGTTLFEAANLGHDAFGMELEPKLAEEAARFFKRFLESERMRHEADRLRVGAPELKKPISLDRFAYARDKAALKDAPARLTIACGDSAFADRAYKKESVHAIVGDLAYGVAHGNASGGGRSRAPSELLRACLPAWRRVLKPGGAIALSWNLYGAKREAVLGILAAAGFRPLTGGPYDALSHRVDQAIQRDAAVAVRD